MNPSTIALRPAIVGAGLGGLATAHALRRRGFDPILFERRERPSEIAAGMELWAFATILLESLGLAEPLRRFGQRIAEARFSSWRGRTLLRIDLEQVERRVGATSYLIERDHLHWILLEAWPSDRIWTGMSLIGLKPDLSSVQLRFEGQPTYEASWVVGADGLHSTVRHSLWGPTPLRKARQICARGIARGSQAEPGLLLEVQGLGLRFGIGSLVDDRVAWWAAVNEERFDERFVIDPRSQLLDLFSGWPWRIPDHLEATDPAQIVVDSMVDRRPLPCWRRGRATILGDAAHPAVPNFGQGACMAIEDGFSLAEFLDRSSTVEKGLERFEEARRPRTRRAVEESWAYGGIARWTSPQAVAIRELIQRVIPDLFWTHLFVRRSRLRVASYYRDPQRSQD